MELDFGDKVMLPNTQRRISIAPWRARVKQARRPPSFDCHAEPCFWAKHLL